MRSKHFIFTFGLLMMLVSCSDETFSTSWEPAYEACNTTDPCPQGSICIQDVCITDAVPSGEYYLRFLPPEGSGIAKSEILEPIVFNDSPVCETQYILLPLMCYFAGNTYTEDSFVLSSTVTATLQGGITTQPLTYKSEKPYSGDDAGFLFRLPTSMSILNDIVEFPSYKLHIVPDGLQIPPYDVIKEIGAEWDPLYGYFALESIDLYLPSIGDLYSMSYILAYHGTILDNADSMAPVMALKVTGLDKNNRQITTSTYTDNEGKFTLYLWPENIKEFSKIRVSSNDFYGNLLPTLTQPITDKESITYAPNNQGSSGSNFFIDMMGDHITVTGHVQTEYGTALTGAEIAFTRSYSFWTHEYKVTTDENGDFTVPLYSGEYNLVITPNHDEYLPARLTRQHVTISSNMQPLQLTANNRTTVHGKVYDFNDDEFVGFARVIAKLEEPDFNDQHSQIENTPSRVFETSIDYDGEFELNLDPGVHSLQIIPGMNSGLASTTYKIVVPDTETYTIPDHLKIPRAGVMPIQVHIEYGYNFLDTEDFEYTYSYSYNDQYYDDFNFYNIQVEAWRKDGDTFTKVASNYLNDNGFTTLIIPIEEPIQNAGL